MAGFWDNIKTGASWAADSAGHRLSYAGNRILDGGRFFYKKSGFATADDVIEHYSVYAHALPYTVLGGFLFLELQQSFQGHEHDTTEYNIQNPLVTAGMTIAAMSALINTGAMLYYRRKLSHRSQSTALEAINDNDSVDSHELPEDATESQRFLHRLEEFASHTVGITFYNFTLGFGAIVPFLKSRTHYATTVSLSVTLSYLLAKCELALHESNLYEAADDHDHSTLSALYNHMITDVREAKTISEKCLAAWFPAGILGSHALAGIFGVSAALQAMQSLLNDGEEIPNEIKVILYLTIPFGAFAHSVSEIQGYKNFDSNLKRLKITLMSMEPKYRMLCLIIALSASCSVLFHVIPEAVAFPMLVEELGKYFTDNEDYELPQITKGVLTGVSAITFGLPDVITTTATTTLPALRKLFESSEGLPLTNNRIVVNVGGTVMTDEQYEKSAWQSP